MDGNGKNIEQFDKLDPDQTYYWLLTFTGPYGETLLGGPVALMGADGGILEFSASDMIRDGLEKFIKMYQEGKRLY